MASASLVQEARGGKEARDGKIGKEKPQSKPKTNPSR